MSKIFMPEVDVAHRKMLLEQNCDSTEQTKYFKSITPEEMDIKREQLTENAIKLSEIEDEKKEIMKGFKEKADPMIQENKELLRELKTRQTEVNGVLYHMANHEEKMMETYDENGEMVASRRLRPEEKQQKLFSIPKAANE